MNNYLKILLKVFLFIGILFLLLRFAVGPIIEQLSPTVETSGRNEEKSTTVSINQEAPHFDLASILGEKISRADLKGQPAVLVFWSTWNSESIDQIKIIDDYLVNESADLKLLGVRIVLINSQENQSSVTNYIKSGGYNVEILFDQSGEVSNNYGIHTLPTTFFIDKRGIIREIFVGTLSQKMIVDKIEKLLE